MKPFTKVVLTAVSIVTAFLMLVFAYYQMTVTTDYPAIISYSFLVVFFLGLGAFLYDPNLWRGMFLQPKEKRFRVGITIFIVGLYLVIQCIFIPDKMDVLVRIVKTIQALSAVVCMFVGMSITIPLEEQAK
jgi:hypothetical protein